VGELAKAIGCAKSTVSRIARTLEREGFLLSRPGRDGYRLGLRLWYLGSSAISDASDFPRCALPHLEELVRRVQQSVQAVILDGTEVVYVQKVDAQHSLRTYTQLGARFPAYCSATGKALLAFQNEEVVQRVIRGGLKAYTDRTVTKPAWLRSELERIRKRGYAMNKGEWRADIGGIAAPVFDRTSKAIGAIGVTMPLTQYPRDSSSEIIGAVVETAQSLSAELGFDSTTVVGQGRKTA
jgi:DNA-binding IclR family transcriptional regulator